MKNGTPNSLARIPIRWMVRECFKTETGIIFDAHMLNQEIGLDINSVLKAPMRLSPCSSSVFSEIRSESPTNLTLWCRPLSWIKGKKSRDNAAKVPKPLRYKAEDEEELNDAVSPIYDQLNMHWYWKAMEYIPCELSPSTHRCQW